MPPSPSIHHYLPPSTTSENISTTIHPDSPPSTITHHQPKYIHHNPTQPTIIHHHQPPPNTIQNISTTTHHHPPAAKVYPPETTNTPKMDHYTEKAIIYSYITWFWHCFGSFFYFKIQLPFPWRRFCVINSWSVCFLNSKFISHFSYLLKLSKLSILLFL